MVDVAFVLVLLASTAPDAVMIPERNASPPTASIAEGDVVPIPSAPDAVRTDASVPEVLYISMIFAV